ncbi:hypothetical protein [Caballeronia sp. S22]|uniref:hypothetical protein n=1 Tax=Caballeronia sp. S22 TaxID=3137182 RepID=UPI0035306198
MFTLSRSFRNARFSKRYRRHADVPKVTFQSHIVMPTMASAESPIAGHARVLTNISAEVLASSLRLAENA